MNILIVGATGATGRLLVEQLLASGHTVKVIVRSIHKLNEDIQRDKSLTIIRASVLDLSDAELTQHVAGCDAVASCVGHSLTLKGIFGQPRQLVTDATRRLCDAIKANAPQQTKFVLMNTAGNSNRDLVEGVSSAENVIITLLRRFMPPHLDNEQAADHLRTQIGQQDAQIEWVAVRPDGLINQSSVTAYTSHPSPTRSAIFNAGKTSRINVAHFMTELITDDALWQIWKGQMPVIYNADSE